MPPLNLKCNEFPSPFYFEFILSWIQYFFQIQSSRELQLSTSYPPTQLFLVHLLIVQSIQEPINLNFTETLKKKRYWKSEISTENIGK